MKKFILTPLLILGSLLIFAQNEKKEQTPIEKKKYVTQKLDIPIKLDGVLDDKAWEAVEWGGDFITYQPNEGKAPHQPTNFKILYDDKFLYVGYRCHDVSPDSVIKRMSRRDQFPG
ncbi:MAG: hypothetical protein H7Y04_13535, partial [Verrucomicrobia bacterium]|nr:hypothetical protein [Cytophagales bacterium]